MKQPLSDAVAADYRLACNGMVLFDLSRHGKLQLTGKDAAAFLNNLCTNDIKELGHDEGCAAFFTNAKARIVAHAWVQCVEHTDGEIAYWLDTAPGLAEILFKHLNHYLISEQVELRDVTQEWAELHVAGPIAYGVLKMVVGADVVAGRVDRGKMTRSVDSAGAACWIRRHDRIALPGYDVLFPTVGSEQQVAKRRFQEAWGFPAREEAFNILRVEAGMPAHGAEIDDTRLAMEVGRTAQAISYNKGCYLGQETIVMARDRGHVNRTLLGLRLSGEEPAAAGAKVFRGDEEIGQVTSSVFSPRVGTAVALAFLRRGHQQPGTPVEVETELGRRPAEVADLPLVPTSPA
jgi:tRNA-modifying protein YgfZ